MNTTFFECGKILLLKIRDAYNLDVMEQDPKNDFAIQKNKTWKKGA